MEPYGQQEEEETIGLFTFYREQEELEQQLKYRIKAESLNNILKKVTKRIDKDNQDKKDGDDGSGGGENDSKSKLRQITEENVQQITKSNKQNNIRLNKSLLEKDNYNISKNNNNKNITSNLIINQHTKQSPLPTQSPLPPPQLETNRQKTNTSSQEYEINQYKQFSKYLSELDMIRLNKKNNNTKMKVLVEKGYGHNEKEYEYEYRSNYSQVLSGNHKKDNNKLKGDKEGDNQNRISVQFKKLALEPQEFCGGGLKELSKSFVPIAMHKKEKMGLKSYRREKEEREREKEKEKERSMMYDDKSKSRSKDNKSKEIEKETQLITTQSQQQKESQLHQQFTNSNNKKSILETLLLNKHENHVNYNFNSNNISSNNISSNKNSKKLISVHRLSAKLEEKKKINKEMLMVGSGEEEECYEIESGNNNNIKSESLPRLKINLMNDVLIHNNNNSINSKININNIINKKPTTKNTLAMSLELQRSHELRSKYQIKQVEKEDESILNLNKRIRSEIKRVKNESLHEVRHYLLMKEKGGEEQGKGGYCSVKECGNGNAYNNNSNHNYNHNKHFVNNDHQQTHHNNSPTTSPQSTSLEKQPQKQQSLSFNKLKEMFCKRDEFLKNHKDKFKTNIFRIEKSEETKIKSMMESKKQEIIDNLIGKLSLV